MVKAGVILFLSFKIEREWSCKSNDRRIKIRTSISIRASLHSKSTRKSHLDLYFQIGFIVVQFYYIHIKHPIKCEFKLKQMRYSFHSQSVCLIYKCWAYPRKYSHMDVILSADCSSFRAWSIISLALAHSFSTCAECLLSSIFVRAHRSLYSVFYALSFFPTSFRFASDFLFNVVWDFL